MAVLFLMAVIVVSKTLKLILILILGAVGITGFLQFIA